MPSGDPIGARLDRLAWSRRHTMIVLALGAGWMFDAFEVQLFGTAIGPLGDHFHASVTARNAVLGVWLVGILVGALIGGPLTDRFGRRRLFVATLLWYAAFTVLTGLAPNLEIVYLSRGLAALGVGAEYAIVNAAIAELVPARVRGRANVVVMNFWPAGAILASAFAYPLLHSDGISSEFAWRSMFILGGALALLVLLLRRRIPESPRWLATRGRYAEAEGVLWSLGGATAAAPIDVEAQPQPPVRTATALRLLLLHYRRRLALGIALDLAEAFGYYGLFALLSVVVLTQIHISGAAIALFFLVGNVGALAGGLTMSAVIDRVGRARTVATAYTAAAVGIGGLAWATATGSAATVTVAFVVANACATAAWTSAYPTFTELFPTALRGTGVGASVAVGRIGAIAGTFALPGLATRLGATASYLLVALFWLAGAAAIVVYTRTTGVAAAGQPLEAIADEETAEAAAA